MKPTSTRVKLEMEVPFHDVDSLQVVWHGHYYKYFEIARTALFRKLDVVDEALLPHGYKWVVIETKCRHTFPLTFGNRFSVEAWLVDIEYRINVAYEIHNLTLGKRAARAHTHIATLDTNNQLLLETPNTLLNYLTDRSEHGDAN